MKAFLKTTTKPFNDDELIHRDVHHVEDDVLHIRHRDDVLVGDEYHVVVALELDDK